MACHQPKGKSTWLRGGRQDVLHLWLHRRKGTALQKRQEAQRVSKINERNQCHLSGEEMMSQLPSPAHCTGSSSSEGAAAAPGPAVVALGTWQDLLRDPGILHTLRESVRTRTLLFLIILCTLPEEETELLQEVTVFWVQNG